MSGTVVHHPLLQGVVGSTAYGLAHEGSDVDRLGVFAAPTVAFHGLSRPTESVVFSAPDPDQTWHEAGKAVKLIMACNPTATEILWLDGYEICTPLGEELIGLRHSLLSAKAVRNAYLGYATQQFRKLQAREVTGTAAPSRRQSEKHARHLVRLTLQGVQLHRTGELMVRLTDPEYVRSLGQLFAENPGSAKDWLGRGEDAFDRPGVLPEKPDTEAAERWLLKVRDRFYKPSEG